MGSLSGILYRPLSAAAAVAVAAVSSDLPDRFAHPKPSERSASEKLQNTPTFVPSKETDSWVSRISVSNITNHQLASTVQHNSDIIHPTLNPTHSFTPKFLYAPLPSTASVPSLNTAYQYARLANPPKDPQLTSSFPTSEVSYRWHLPNVHTSETSGKSSCQAVKSQTVVVLLGWLGAKQKHLNKYAEWYTSQGFHVVTFTFPMSDVLSYKVGGRAEQNVDLLADHLAGWVAEEHGKNLVFHTFSNTGWLTYGVILEKFQKQDPSLMQNIKGCIIDSAPVAAPDPQVWALGFSTAFLKKRSVGTKGSLDLDDTKLDELVGSKSTIEPKPAAAEAALLVILEKFFDVVLNLPSVNRRLVSVLNVLTSEQPKCPQLYVYSSSDRVIPVKSVESFIERQRKAGHSVKACDFVSSPHVDHFRNHPSLYSSQLTTFMEESVLNCCQGSP